MPAKAVTQYTCDRCERVWYRDTKEEVPQANMTLTFDKFPAKTPTPSASISSEGVSSGGVRFECLCDSCTETVGNLIKQIAKEFKPRAPRAKKKDESAEQGKPQSTDTSSPTTSADVAPASKPPSTPPGAAPLPNGGASTGVAKPSTAGASPVRPR